MILTFMFEGHSITIMQACSLVSENHYFVFMRVLVLFLFFILKSFGESVCEILAFFL